MGLVPAGWMFHIIMKQHLGQYNLGFSWVLLFFNMIPKNGVVSSNTYIPWLHPNLTGILTGRWLGPHVATHDSQSASIWPEDPLDMYDIAASGLNTLPTMQIQFIYRYKHIQTRYNMQSQTQLLLVFSDWCYSSSQFAVRAFAEFASLSRVNASTASKAITFPWKCAGLPLYTRKVSTKVHTVRTRDRLHMPTGLPLDLWYLWLKSLRLICRSLWTWPLQFGDIHAFQVTLAHSLSWNNGQWLPIETWSSRPGLALFFGSIKKHQWLVTGWTWTNCSRFPDLQWFLLQIHRFSGSPLPH